jgi:hypothetical protein
MGEVVDAIVGGDAAAPSTGAAVVRLCRHGATSGVDALAGVDAGLAVLAAIAGRRAVAA